MSGKRALIRGTAILTITSFVTRFMGFFYRIFFGSYLWRRKCRPLSTLYFLYMPLASLFLCRNRTCFSRVAQENAAGHPKKQKNY